MPLQRVMPLSKSVFKVIAQRIISVWRACPENIVMFAYYLFLLLNPAMLHFAVYCITLFLYVHVLWSISSQLCDHWTVTCVWMLPHTQPSCAILTVLLSVRCPRGVLGDPALMRTARIRQPKKVRLSLHNLAKLCLHHSTWKSRFFIYSFIFNLELILPRSFPLWICCYCNGLNKGHCHNLLLVQNTISWHFPDNQQQQFRAVDLSGFWHAYWRMYLVWWHLYCHENL